MIADNFTQVLGRHVCFRMLLGCGRLLAGVMRSVALGVDGIPFASLSFQLLCI
jgi:hypothetical protein